MSGNLFILIMLTVVVATVLLAIKSSSRRARLPKVMTTEDAASLVTANQPQRYFPWAISAAAIMLIAWPWVVYIWIGPLLPNPRDFAFLAGFKVTAFYASVSSIIIGFAFIFYPRQTVLGIVLSIIAMFAGCFSMIPQIDGPGGDSPMREWVRSLPKIRLLEASTKYFRQEYGHLPQATNSYDLSIILNGLIDPVTGEDVSKRRADLLAQNPERIRFMHCTAKDFKRTSSGEFVLCDAWGTPYSFAFDNGIGGVYYSCPDEPTRWPDDKAGDGVIVLPFGNHDVIHADCAFFSNGRDLRTGSKQLSADDLVSWITYAFAPDNQRRNR